MTPDMANIAAVVMLGFGIATRQPVAIAAGCLMLVALVFIQRRAPEASRKMREGLMGDPSNWTEEERHTILTTDSIDLLKKVALKATDRRTEAADKWFLSHFFEHGPDWLVTDPDGEIIPATIQRLSDIPDRFPPDKPLALRLRDHSIVAEAYDHRASWWSSRKPPSRCWDFRPAHCQCFMPTRGKGELNERPGA